MSQRPVYARSLSSSSSPGGSNEDGEGEAYFPHLQSKDEEGEPHFCHLQTSNFCHEAPNKSERPDSKYEEGDQNKWSLNSEEEQHSSREEKEPMYQDQKEQM